MHRGQIWPATIECRMCLFLLHEAHTYLYSLQNTFTFLRFGRLVLVLFFLFIWCKNKLISCVVLSLATNPARNWVCLIAQYCALTFRACAFQFSLRLYNLMAITSLPVATN